MAGKGRIDLLGSYVEASPEEPSRSTSTGDRGSDAPPPGPRDVFDALVLAAALDAVRQWEYTPTLLDGVPTPVKMVVTVTFRLKRASRG